MSDSPTSENPITIRELAEKLNVSTDKAYQLGNDPLFPSFRVGNRHRFMWSDVLAHLQRPTDDWAQSARSRGRKRTGR